MTKLKEYLEEAKVARHTSLTVPSTNALERAIVNALERAIVKELPPTSLVRISNTKAYKFSHKVSEIATSSEVIGELSDEIGLPNSSETEDEFVDRAKLTLSRILKRKLSG